jgi:hypothetical protein
MKQSLEVKGLKVITVKNYATNNTTIGTNINKFFTFVVVAMSIVISSDLNVHMLMFSSRNRCFCR